MCSLQQILLSNLNDNRRSLIHKFSQKIWLVLLHDESFAQIWMDSCRKLTLVDKMSQFTGATLDKIHLKTAHARPHQKPLSVRTAVSSLCAHKALPGALEEL